MNKLAYFIFFTSLIGCSSFDKAVYNQRLMKVAETSYFYGCIYGVDKVSVKYLECYNEMKSFRKSIESNVNRE